MKSTSNISLQNVQSVYSGPEGDLWELVMGQQIHIGGFQSSMDLANQAQIQPHASGIDLCCCNGAGMRFLVRFKNVKHMIGVDATQHVIARGQQRTQAESLADRIAFVLSDVTNVPLPSNSADFVWGEDAWCYVADKPKLIAEAARLAKPAGTIAFTDWVEGPNPLSAAEAERLLKFMKFPNIQDIPGYSTLLQQAGCTVLLAQDTGRFPPHVDLYLNMLNMQLTYDALRIINFDTDLMAALAKEMTFMQQLAHQNKLIQALFIGRKA